MIVKVVYVLITIAIAIALLGWIIAAFAGDQVALGVALLVLGWIPALLYLAFFRMTLEFYYSVVRMSQGHQPASPRELSARPARHHRHPRHDPQRVR